jgi:hypothetical protein
MKKLLVFSAIFVIVPCLWAQAIRGGSILDETQIPLRRVVILTSGLACYEHSGAVNGSVSIALPFRLDAINDALKTLAINDPATVNPSIIYQSEQTLLHTLRSLQIDLSDEPGMAVILSRLRGAEVEIAAPAPFTGRIAGIEYRQILSSNFMQSEPWLLLNTADGMRLFRLNEIDSIRFVDSAIEQDLNRALDLIAASRNSFSRELMVNLPGSGRRDVSISYVIPSPVWKVSYRLDLGAARPLFQGWAIVDNDSDSDWNNVELSLVTGRPTSFIQNLYPPYYVWRPVLPLSIAGTAQAAVHDRGYTQADAEWTMSSQRARAEMQLDESPIALSRAPASPAPNLAGGTVETAAGSDAGGQFEFTIRNPVSLDRRMSAMLPLVDSPIQANKLLIYNGRGRHPRLGAEITNTTGMKLPAGPITVYDGGVYAGDALIEFWNENEKRLISFGEDLSVTAGVTDSGSRTVSSVNVSGGVMTINRRQAFIKTYTFINSSSVSKQLVVEHSKTANTTLVSPQAAEETITAYRFNINLPANRETSLTVNEQRPLAERITLLSLRPDVFLSYTTNQEIPPRVREALQRAVELRRIADTAEQTVRNLEAQRDRLIVDQDRIRRNLEAAGSQTPQGEDYLRRLVLMDSEIDALTPNLERAISNSRAAQEAWENYLVNLNL